MMLKSWFASKMLGKEACDYNAAGFSYFTGYKTLQQACCDIFLDVIQ